MVVAVISSFCEVVNVFVQGYVSEEKFILFVKQVVVLIVQLLVVCKVKVDQDLEVMKWLQVVGNVVKRVLDNFVCVVQKVVFGKVDDDDVVVKIKFVGGIVQIIVVQEEMLKKE